MDGGFTVNFVSTAASIVRAAVFVTEPALIVIVADVFVDTGLVVIGNVTDVLPAGIVTEPGTPAEGELLDRSRANPPLGAGPLIVTVQLDDVPPMTVVGLRLTEVTTGASTVTVAVFVTCPSVAEIVAVTLEATASVFTVKVADVAPAATVTADGTVASGELLDKFIGTPPVGAAETIVTVPVDNVPPVPELGLTETELTGGGYIVSIPVLETEPSVPVIVA
jgi:hypothetical protein